MVRPIRGFLPVWFLLPAIWGIGVGCNCGQGIAPEPVDPPEPTEDGGVDAGDQGPCGVNCEAFETPQCTVAVCNTGQYVGPLNTCIVVSVPEGTTCDDGQFCTIGDACNAGGTCVGGSQNKCGIKTVGCEAVVCYEDSKSCDVTPVNDGDPCTPSNLCEVNGICKIGECKGEPKDCWFSPKNECNTVACNPSSGLCEGIPDPKKDDAPCVLTGDPCNINRTCKAGVCQGGKPKDCSALNVQCQVGACDPGTGICGPVPAPVNTVCTEGIPECKVGKCDVKGLCVASSASNGVACNDHNACTKTDVCTSGSCAGVPIGGCVLYLQEGFESCQNGWTLSGDWECGKPEVVGPVAAHSGQNCIATQIDDNYHVSQSYGTCTASSPSVDLTQATNPVLSFWAWVNTEGGTFDGWNVKASTDGVNFVEVATVDPPYNLTVGGQAAWGGNHAAEGWKHYTADLTAFAGLPVTLRFAFRSDAAAIFPGVYIDDLIVAEPQENPIFITTPNPLPDVYAGMAYAKQITKTGGTNNSVWSLKQGGVNDDWITIDQATGMLGGTPKAMDAGPVSVTVHVNEPLLPSNFAEKTFTFNVNPDAYYTSFEGACPDGWTLTGDWECGVPMSVGPAAAFIGTQCIGTKIAGLYTDGQAWDTTTATSPDIDLTGVQNPILTFRMWIDTEGSTYDGANLQISTDGGMNYAIVNTVNPAYPLTVGGKPAWGGHQGALDWQLVTADLSAFAGKTIRLRFAFRSDSSGVFPGVYIDDILVN